MSLILRAVAELARGFCGLHVAAWQLLGSCLAGLVVLNTRVASNGAVWGEDFVLADVPLIERVAGKNGKEKWHREPLGPYSKN